MTLQMSLFKPYPEPGLIADLGDGFLVEVWPDEGCGSDTFCGRHLNASTREIHLGMDVSCFWRRDIIIKTFERDQGTPA